MARYHVDLRLEIDATDESEAQEILDGAVGILTIPGVEDVEIIFPLELEE